jgi:hypothetical protein
MVFASGASLLQRFRKTATQPESGGEPQSRRQRRQKRRRASVKTATQPESGGEPLSTSQATLSTLPLRCRRRVAVAARGQGKCSQAATVAPFRSERCATPRAPSLHPGDLEWHGPRRARRAILPALPSLRLEGTSIGRTDSDSLARALATEPRRESSSTRSPTPFSVAALAPPRPPRHAPSARKRWLWRSAPEVAITSRSVVPAADRRGRPRIATPPAGLLGGWKRSPESPLRRNRGRTRCRAPRAAYAAASSAWRSRRHRAYPGAPRHFSLDSRNRGRDHRPRDDGRRQNRASSLPASCPARSALRAPALRAAASPRAPLRTSARMRLEDRVARQDQSVLAHFGDRCSWT